MNADLEQLKAEHAEYLQLVQLKDFMAAVNDLLHKKDAELEALRKIAACFEEGDSALLKYLISAIGGYTSHAEDMILMRSVQGGIMTGMLIRLERAAQLAEETC